MLCISKKQSHYFLNAPRIKTSNKFKQSPFSNDQRAAHLDSVISALGGFIVGFLHNRSYGAHVLCVKDFRRALALKHYIERHAEDKIYSDSPRPKSFSSARRKI